jgi:SAM-dependent methyltransferase
LPDLLPPSLSPAFSAIPAKSAQVPGRQCRKEEQGSISLKQEGITGAGALKGGSLVQEEIRKKIESVRWYHAYEVLPGIVTPGQFALDVAAAFKQLGVPEDLHGKRALDIGTWDGPIAFELEKRGADVDAIDVQDPNCTAFNCAHALRQSKVRYTQMSVYDVAKHFPHKFDVIFFYGVYYHLKHPLLALEALAEALADGGRIYFEGELLLTYSETNDGERSDLDNPTLAASRVPLSLCYTGDYKSASNWFVPNLACLKGWFEAAGLDILNYHLFSLPDREGGYPCQRISGVACKSSDLGTMAEIPLFDRNLEMAGKWWSPVLLRRARNQQQSTDAERVRGAVRPPSRLTRALRRLFRRTA